MFGRGDKCSNGMVGLEEECRKTLSSIWFEKENGRKSGMRFPSGILFVCPFRCQLIMFYILSSQMLTFRLLEFTSYEFPCVDEC